MKSIRLEPEAKQELAAAATRYEQRREGLGRELISEVDAVLAAIARNPGRFILYPRVDERLSVRRALLRRFPYAVVFIDVGAAIRIVAVAHERQQPGYWLVRLR